MDTNHYNSVRFRYIVVMNGVLSIDFWNGKHFTVITRSLFFRKSFCPCAIYGRVARSMFRSKEKAYFFNLLHAYQYFNIEKVEPAVSLSKICL